MPIDAVGISIVLGLLTAALFAFFEFRHNPHIDFSNNAGNIDLVFLAATAILPGLQLIWAAIRGDPNDLPSKWREYLAVAALVGLWLAVAHLYRAFGKVLETTSKLGNEPHGR